MTDPTLPTLAELRRSPSPTTMLLECWPAWCAAAADAEGWNLFHTGRRDGPALQADDEARRFASDDDAADFVLAGAEPHHDRARALLARIAILRARS